MGSYKNRLYPRMTERPLRFRLNPYSPLYYGLVLAFLGEGAQEGCTHAIDSGPYHVPTRHYEGQPAIYEYDSYLGRHVMRVTNDNMRTIRLAYDVVLEYPWFCSAWAKFHAYDILIAFGGTGGGGRTFFWNPKSVNTIEVAGTNNVVSFPILHASVDTTWQHFAGGTTGTLAFGWFKDKTVSSSAAAIGNFPIRYLHGRESGLITSRGAMADLMAWNRPLTDSEGRSLGDPGNVDLRVGGVPLILPPRRRSWPGITITTQDEVITLPTLLAEC
ncbi:MAG: hypothetical protein KatS3mg038_3317 [Candidatus Kapaibacterium sp.]|nr:MAG: hypothetical protein KatS3mg038_3317 [Candidatus Kapabacteria bacterium]